MCGQGTHSFCYEKLFHGFGVAWRDLKEIYGPGDYTFHGEKLFHVFGVDLRDEEVKGDALAGENIRFAVKNRSTVPAGIRNDWRWSDGIRQALIAKMQSVSEWPDRSALTGVLVCDIVGEQEKPGNQNNGGYKSNETSMDQSGGHDGGVGNAVHVGLMYQSEAER